MTTPFVRLRTIVRPLACASGRVASTRRAAGLVTALTVALAACGVGANVSGPGGGIATGGGGGGGGGSGTTPAFTQVTAGDEHTCALSETGIAWCWGANGRGQLGVEDTLVRTRPDTVRISGRTFRQLSAGGAHTCAIDTNGGAWCWGSNSAGQLGSAAPVSFTSIPSPVNSTRGWLSISAGRTHTCAVTDTGVPFCWGSNASGELGNGGTTASVDPVQVSGLSDVLAITAGDGFSCALRSNGTSACWGRAGQLGTDGGSLVPVSVSGTASFGGLDAGGQATCALEPALQRASCWGQAGATGATTPSGSGPQRVALDVDLGLVSSGGASACALTGSGLARCWGSNASGQLGIASTATASQTPLPVSGDLTYRTISVGGAHACAITALLQTFCWGSNASGQLGLGVTSATPVRTPTRVP